MLTMSNCQQCQIVNNVKLSTKSNCQQCQIVNNVKLSTMSNSQIVNNVKFSNCQIVTISNVMYYQSVWIRLAHQLYTDFQYFFKRGV